MYVVYIYLFMTDFPTGNLDSKNKNFSTLLIISPQHLKQHLNFRRNVVCTEFSNYIPNWSFLLMVSHLELRHSSSTENKLERLRCISQAFVPDTGSEFSTSTGWVFRNHLRYAQFSVCINFICAEITSIFCFIVA